ncbi:4Fe-4S binding protein [Ideonella sp.]|uniref:4Fe-4S binding protein n=1 Tax=Ideonella sp. TaxID=1929293 RepID=UPI002B48A33F|nr:4Fe-4S binding protein [Ideonella sp.]HJV71507.1 4Fe-4S binding protein [Ideonella sp.]
MVALVVLAAALPARAGVMTREALQVLFPAPLMLGERDAALPVWPVFKQEATSTVLVAYVFESIDLAPVPGFSGTPLNLLVALDAQGSFLDVRVLSQHEPVFLDGLGPAPLFRFVEQYRGLSLKQSIKVGGKPGDAARADSAAVTIDGVAKATASVRIVNQSLLAASLKVARAKLGYAAGRDPELVGRVRSDLAAERLGWAELQRAGLVQHVTLTRGQVEQAFAGTVGQGLGPAGPADAPYMEFWLAHLGVPPAAASLLGEAGRAHLQGRLDAGDHALLVVARGAGSFIGDAFVRGAVPDRLTLRQGELPLELRDMDLDDPLALPPELRGAESKVFRVIGPAGLDPSQPIEFRFRVTRSKGIVYPERVSRDFPLPFALPGPYVTAPEADAKSWRGIWAARAAELGVLGAALVLLAAVLARPRWLIAKVVGDARRLAWVRNGFLAFTLVFIGWFAQGQLSIVNLTALLQALRAGHSLGFFLYDPVTLVLWGFVALTLVVWGRGTFCGWLCPFGALQELVSQLAARLKLPRLRLHRRTDARLKRLKYGLLALLLASTLVPGGATDALVELEPFKTAITLGFVRTWPYVLWAGALVASSAFLYKSYCRYLCPLGAGLAVLGRLRRWDWIARRAECGTPCQTCRHRCEYQAIRPDGRIDYAECFQCLDCVAIHADPRRCAPLIAQARGGRRIVPIHPLAPSGAAP